MIPTLLACVSSGPAPESAPPQTEGLVLQVQDLPDDSAYTTHFDRFVDVYGVRVLGASGVPDAKLLHAATIAAEYLDNDADGVADDADVVQALSDNVAVLVMFPSARALMFSGVFRAYWVDQVTAQDLAADETDPGGFDPSVEEVLHLLQTAGYAHVYPELSASETGNALTLAMDTARGGHFQEIPRETPADAWYHYDDGTCDYDCMASEYFYWALTSRMGLQQDRCGEIDHEWELCTPDQVRDVDVDVTALLDTSPVPQVGPDGVYDPG
jgi:hypothetical protein